MITFKTVRRLLNTLKLIKSDAEYVEITALSLTDVDYIDELIEDAYKDQFNFIEVKTSILEYDGHDEYILNLKALSLKINRLREPLLFDGEL
jgi:hypothetical protein